MHVNWERLSPRDRERLLGQMIRMERDLRWRLDRHELESQSRGEAHGAAVQKRLSLLLRNLRGRIAAAREYLGNANAFSDPSTAGDRKAPAGNR